MELNERQQRFVDEYIKTGVAYSAALAAGYSETYASVSSHKLLENVRIKAALDERLNGLRKSTIADQEEILEFLTSIVRGEVSEPVAILDGAGRQRIEHLTPSVQTRKGAAEQLGKRYALWTEKQDVTVTGAVQFIDDIGGDEDAT